MPAGLAAGPYTLTYQICEVANPTFCDTVTETVTVSGILAVDDAPVTISGAAGGATPTVLGNDTLNGVPATPATVTISPGVAPAPAAGSITMNPATGVITVAAGTTPGTYLYPYTICGIANPGICSTATATVVVAASVIAAVSDSYGPFGPTGGSTPSVLVNDTINGVAVVPASIALTPGAAPTPAVGSITMNGNGTITVAPGTTPGTYSYPYTICEVAQPANCASAIATVVVGAPTGAVLVTDISRGNAPGTAVTVSVITNDSDPLGVFNPATLQIVGTAGPGLPLVAPGQGTWSVNLTNGTITFTPEPGFTGNPTPIPYQLQDLSGNLIAPALVIVLYESAPVFVCSEIIGKVFEDPNFNGRQDDGEVGMPGVRIATVNGKIITTDEYGRYHVPCAMLPKDTGSNFLLKVDPRSLPSGFRFTTENPRVVRLSQGMMSRMNFGVALSNLVEVDLSAAAFGTGQGGVSVALDDALDTLAARIADTPSVVRLNYHLKGETRQVAKARLDAVEDALRAQWKGTGRYKLIVEQTLVRPK